MTTTDDAPAAATPDPRIPSYEDAIAALRDGIWLARSDGTLDRRILEAPYDPATHRFNDGRVDRLSWWRDLAALAGVPADGGRLSG